MDEIIDTQKVNTVLDPAKDIALAKQSAWEKVFGPRRGSPMCTTCCPPIAQCDERWTDVPSVAEFNSPDFGKVSMKDLEPEILTLNTELTSELKDKILQEFQDAAKIANVKPIETHPVVGDFYGEDTKCPILNKPDEIMTKIREVFGTEENDAYEQSSILSYIQNGMPNRNISWKEECLYVDGARTNITCRSLGELVVRKLKKVFGQEMYLGND